MLLQLVDLFLAEYGRMLDELRRARAAQDGPRLARAAHSMKGSLSYFAVQQARETACRLEELGKRQCFDEADVYIRQLAGNLQRLAPELKAFKQRTSKCAS